MAFTGLLKPCYVFAPKTALRRLTSRLRGPSAAIARVTLPWRHTLEVSTRETIGRELLHQNVFDIAVSELAWRLLSPGDVAVDIGANIGYLTSLFAARVGRTGRVEAFEPHPRVFARLQRNISSLPENAARVTLHQCALGSETGTATLFEPAAFGTNEGTSTLARRESDAPVTDASGLQVRVARYDELLPATPVTLLKVDVEGFEIEVFKGAAQSLHAHAIRNIVYEAHDCERSPLHPLLEDYGYTICGIGHDLFGPRVTRGRGAPLVDRAWESPSYLATLDPERTLSTVQARGWRVLRGS